MAKAREFKNIKGISLFPETKTCYLKGDIGLKPCDTIELRNVEIKYSREMPSATLVNFKKPVTCYFDASEKILFCGTYGRK